MRGPNCIVEIKRLYPDAKLPVYATDNAAGMDLCAVVAPGQWKPDCFPGYDSYNTDNCLWLAANDRALISTGIAISLPPGYEAQIRPRSGLAVKHGLTVLNSPGTIDADYRGEVKVLLINLGRDTVTIAHGDRIAQLVVAPVARVGWQLVDDLTMTRRGDGGFGSTGK